jgi:zinc protease
MRFAKFLAALLLAGFAPGLLALPQIQTWTTGNGARVYFVPAPQLPMVDVRVVFDGGSARDGSQPGRALLTNALLAEGAGRLDADGIADAFDRVGADFSNDSLRDMTLVGLRTVTDPKLMTQAVETAALVLNEPTFPRDALERERQRLLVAMRAKEQSPEEIADRRFFTALYGDHPYAHRPIGDEQSVRALTRDDLIAHYRTYYVGRNAVVAIVGALDRNGAERLAEQLVGRLPAGAAAPALPPVPPVPPTAKASRIDIVFPSTQTHILMGQTGMRRDDPDYFPLYVGNFILGGSGLVSRVSDEVREKRGLAYSAYSGFTPMRLEGPFTLGLQTATANTPQALQVLRDTLEKFEREGPTDKELIAAKKNITGGFPLAFDSNSEIVGFLALIGFYGLPLDYLDTYTRNVESVTVAQIRDAFRRRIHPEAMVTVTVGAVP